MSPVAAGSYGHYEASNLSDIERIGLFLVGTGWVEWICKRYAVRADSVLDWRKNRRPVPIAIREDLAMLLRTEVQAVNNRFISGDSPAR